MPDRGFFRIEYYIPDGNGPLYQERSYIRRRNLENSSQRIQEIGIGSFGSATMRRTDGSNNLNSLQETNQNPFIIPDELSNFSNYDRDNYNLPYFREDDGLSNRFNILDINSDRINNGVSNDIMEKMKESTHLYNKKVHGKDAICVICQEKFNKKSKLISCSGCKQSFCAGIDSECKGIIYHAKTNKYCPCCRKNIEDWDFKQIDVPKVQPVKYNKIVSSLYISSLTPDCNEVPSSKNKKYKNKHKNNGKYKKSRYKNIQRPKKKYSP
tara:strand:+ start:30 stop:833 length:804 start_codon:yes stop_codon:yes gene_type:complete